MRVAAHTSPVEENNVRASVSKIKGQINHATPWAALAFAASPGSKMQWGMTFPWFASATSAISKLAESS